MKFIIKIFISLILLAITLQAKQIPNWQKRSGWKDISIYAKANGVTEKDMKAVTPKTFAVYWAGRVTKFYWNKAQNRVTKVKIRVTWSSPRGKSCGKIVQLPINGYKDLNFRSTAMYKCK